MAAACAGALWLGLALFLLGNAGDTPGGCPAGAAYSATLAGLALAGAGLIALGCVRGIGAATRPGRAAGGAVAAWSGAAVVAAAWTAFAFGLVEVC